MATPSPRRGFVSHPDDAHHHHFDLRRPASQPATGVLSSNARSSFESRAFVKSAMRWTSRAMARRMPSRRRSCRGRSRPRMTSLDDSDARGALPPHAAASLRKATLRLAAARAMVARASDLGAHDRAHDFRRPRRTDFRGQRCRVGGRRAAWLFVSLGEGRRSWDFEGFVMLRWFRHWRRRQAADGVGNRRTSAPTRRSDRLLRGRHPACPTMMRTRAAKATTLPERANRRSAPHRVGVSMSVINRETGCGAVVLRMHVHLARARTGAARAR